MDDMISREAAISAVRDGFMQATGDMDELHCIHFKQAIAIASRALREVPGVGTLSPLPKAVDAVRVVRCRYCKEGDDCAIRDILQGVCEQKDPYCSWGKRKDDGDV